MTYSYKDVKTKRGFNYHYLYNAPKDGKPVLLFMHGFPSTHWDWRHQIRYFSKKGYGLIVPDMLGYGGTDKPTDKESFVASRMAADMIDILDTENMPKAIAIGHDWGCLPASRLANLHADRFLGFAWLTVGYMVPNPDFDFDKTMALVKQAIGTEIGGYQVFFNKPESAGIIEKNIDSFLSLLYPDDPDLWKTWINPLGKTEEYITNDRQEPVASYLSQEDIARWKDDLLKGGFESPLQWYRAMNRGAQNLDSAAIPKETYHIQKPVFWAAANRDEVGRPEFMKQGIDTYAKDAKVIAYDTGHWVQLEQPDKLNKDLEEWIISLNA